MVQNKVAPATAEEIKAQETALNQILANLKSKSISKEEHERLWAEAYQKAVSLLDYKIKMGKELAEIKAASGQRTDLAPVGSKVSKKALYEALDLTRKQSDDYQLLAKNPEAVEQAKLEAKENKCLPTVYFVKKIINRPKNAAANENAVDKTQGGAASIQTPQYFNLFADNMKCAELPSDCGVEDFVNTTVEKLNEGTYSGKTYIYFEASQDKFLEFFTKIKEMADEAQIGICIRHE